LRELHVPKDFPKRRAIRLERLRLREPFKRRKMIRGRCASLRRRVNAMASDPIRKGRALALLVCMPFFFALFLCAQDKPSDSKAKPDAAPKEIHLTIVVTSAEDKKPVDSASVYVKFAEERKFGKDKKIEMNLKTNLSGVVHVPVIPPGRFLVQVIAPGWKTFGEYYDVSQSDQTINIELARPPKWY
jgi:hypothetical protein